MWSICTRSPPSSIIILAWCESTSDICPLYSSSVAPCHAYTFNPASTRAAATSSCVESGLLPVIYISAPPAASTLQRYAVLASKCIERAIFLPANGFVCENSSSKLRRSGQFLRTHSILCPPEGESFISLIWLIIIPLTRLTGG